jgi:preprotein translocase subunit SecD
MKKFISLIATGLFTMAVAATAAPTPPVFQLRLVVDQPTTNTEPMDFITHNPQSSHTNVLNIEKSVLLDQTALKSAAVIKDGLGQPVVSLVFTDAGAKQFAAVTRQNVHRQLAIIIDGRLCSVPHIMMEISGGTAQISGRFSKQEAKALAAKINDALAGK